MAKGVILLTDKGVYLNGTIQCSNGSWFDAEGCFNYCNFPESEFSKSHQAHKLLCNSTILSFSEKNNDSLWYKNRANFIDTDIGYEVDQSYKEL